MKMFDIRRLTRGMFLKAVSTVAVGILGLATSVILNRYFGYEKYALLILVYTATSFCASLSNLGTVYTINRFVPRYMHSDQERKKAFALIDAAFLIQIFGTLLFCALLYFLSDFIAKMIFKRPELAGYISAGTIFFAGFSIVYFVLQLFQGLQDWLREAFFSVIYPLLYLIIACIFIFLLKFDLKSTLYANAIAACVTIISGLVFLPAEIKSKIFKKINLSAIAKETRVIFKFGSPLLLSGFLFYLLSWADKAILGIYRSNTELTFYYIAILFFNVFMELLKVAATVLMPYMGEISNDPIESIKNKFELIFKWYIHLIILFSIFLYFAIKPAINKLYGPDYSTAVSAFRFLLIVFIIRAIGNPTGMFLVNVFGKANISFWLTAITVFAYIISNFLLVPIYGYKGAIGAGIIAYSLNYLCVLIFVKEIRRITPFRVVRNALLFLGIIFVLYLSLEAINFQNIYILAIFLPIAYLLLMKLFNEIDSRDLAVTREMLKGLSWRTS